MSGTQIMQTLPLELRRSKWLGIRVLLSSLDKMELEDFREGGEALLRDFHVRGGREPYMAWGYLYVDASRAEESAAVDTIANGGKGPLGTMRLRFTGFLSTGDKAKVPDFRADGALLRDFHGECSTWPGVLQVLYCSTVLMKIDMYNQ